MSEPEDVLLWNRFRQGDDVALGQLMQRHFSALYHYGCSFCQRPDLVDDTIQELFFDLWNNRAKLPVVQYVKTYLLSALRNRLIDTLRRSSRVFLQGDWTDDELGFESEFTIESQVVEEEQQQLHHLQQQLQRLTRRQREAIYLRFHQNLTNEAIAELMQISRSAVANLISTALTQLRKHWGITTSTLIGLLSEYYKIVEIFSL